MRLFPGRAPAVSPVLWTADAERPFAQEWVSVTDPANNQGVTSDVATFPTTRISQDATVKAAGAASYRFDVQAADADFYDANAQRTELGMGNPTRPDLDRLFNTGDERWIAWQVRLDPSFLVNVATWQLVLQLKQLGAFGSPVFGLSVRDGQWRLDRTSNDPTNQWPASLNPLYFLLGPAVTGQWIKFLLHIRFHYDPAIGFVEMWGDLADGQGYRSLLTKTMQSTQKLSDGTGGYALGQPIPVHLRAGIYRDKAIGGATSVWYDNFTVAVSRTVAELKAGIT